MKNIIEAIDSELDALRIQTVKLMQARRILIPGATNASETPVVGVWKAAFVPGQNGKANHPMLGKKQSAATIAKRVASRAANTAAKAAPAEAPAAIAKKKKKRNLSADGRKRIAEAQRARWAAMKAAPKT